MVKTVSTPASEGGKQQGSVANLLYPPASYLDCMHPFTSLRRAWEYCRRTQRKHFVAQLQVRRLLAYDRRGGRVPWPPSYAMRPARLSICFYSVADNVEMWGTVFGAVMAYKDVQDGDMVYVRAGFREWNGETQLGDLELLPSHYIGRVVPKYHANRRLGTKDNLESLAKDALNSARQQAVATILQQAQTDEMTLLQAAETGFHSLEAVLCALHAPISIDEAELAKSAAKKLSAAALLLSRDRFIRRPSEPRSVIPNLEQHLPIWVERLPFGLTSDQKTAIREICADLAHHQPMLRLLSGDVGTGKTMTYLLPALAAQRAGFKVAILIPNVLVANQVANELRTLSPETPSVLLGGASKGKPDLSANPIVVGTTALLGQLAKYPLDLLICDEQHKLSEQQRSKLIKPWTNVLEATATAVPRTAALVEFGAMDVSVLKECPYQKTIYTRLVPCDTAAKKSVMAHLKSICAEGSQIAVVYPRLSNSERGRGAEDAALMWEAQFPGQVVTIHGRMEDGEKEAAIQRMKQREAMVLVATTVIEVGITLPSLSAILIADPDLLGLAQLHQLRGRVARHGGNGYCYMAPSRELEEETIERLKLMEKHDSGFALQEADMLARGMGNLISGEEQTGNRSVLFEGVKLLPEDLLA
ncbi:DEAD/DEAH box helicase [Gulbenkiania mobilis]|uniref:DEAD/DEAH box helicase n=1 Tax=Gulbenkiania mobilis TaxID=397457 RepID=UPI0009F9D2A0|nr:DEAD/DEAH box helicase [Gulbenkiania mobilis]